MEKDTNAEWIDFLSSIGGKTTYTSTTVKTTIKQDKPLISIPLDKLFEFYANLVLAGFDRDEALIITVGVATNARGD